jgi:hypothetical protein
MMSFIICTILRVEDTGLLGSKLSSRVNDCRHFEGLRPSHKKVVCSFEISAITE